jgi:hypothetical protein
MATRTRCSTRRTLRSTDVFAAAALLLVLGCATAPTVVPDDAGMQPEPDAGAPPDAGTPDAGPDVELLSVIDLPRMTSTQGLSGTWFEASTGILYALQDTGPHITQLVVAGDFKSILVGAQLNLTGRPNLTWDGEALTRVGDEFYASTDEETPLLERFTPSGAYLGGLTVPANYSMHTYNHGVEGMSAEPDGGFLFICNEESLDSDGPQSHQDNGTTVRILRRDLGTQHDEERAYRTEPLGAGGTASADMGVSDLLALGPTDLLVLERGYQGGYGNTVRIFRVDYSMGADVIGVASLSLSTPVLTKTLVVDIGTLPSNGISNPGVQPNPILDNFEGLALGPRLDDGRRVIFVTSDDNARATQVPRVLVLAIRGL